ncbi:MAG: hypothetical protein CHACPFDD_02932 [Phycisphaerae bacterium]|nr:hypothetical protein [Phycisphaerae bacterium]
MGSPEAKLQQQAVDATAPQVRRRAPATPGELLQDVDTLLMLQVGAGDAEAATTLVRRNFSRVLRYVGRIVRNPSAAEDLTQDVFLQILTHARDYQPRARFSTWLYRVATNRTMSYLRQHQAKRAASAQTGENVSRIADGREPGPDSPINLRELQQHVAAALARLPINQRVALTLFEFEDLSYEQIAAILEVTAEAVRCLLSRARAALRQQLSAFSP